MRYAENPFECEVLRNGFANNMLRSVIREDSILAPVCIRKSDTNLIRCSVKEGLKLLFGLPSRFAEQQ